MKITAFGDHRVFEAKLKAMPKNIRNRVRWQLKRAADVIAAEARKNAPRKTGALRDSIRTRSAPYTRGRVTNDLMWEVHVNIEYAGYVEFGTSRPTPEFRFLRNAVRNTKQQVLKMISEAINQGIQDTVETVGVRITSANIGILDAAVLA